MEITINDDIFRDYIRERMAELFGGRESITAHDIATAAVPLQDRAWLLSRLLGPRDTTREVARRIARDALGNREIPQAYRAWLDTGDEALRKAAGATALALVRSASRSAALALGRSDAGVAARSSAWSAAWSAAWSDAGAAADSVAGAATWAVAGVADYVARGAAWQKYIGWMAEWLDSHETL
jgi:hypothetical protein